MSPWSANQPGSPGSGWRNSARRASPSSSRVAWARPAASRSGPLNRSKWTARASVARTASDAAADDLLGEVREQRPSGRWSRSRTASRLPDGAERSASMVSRTAAGQPLVALRIRRRGVAGRVARHDVRGQERRHERLDLVGRERERRAADVRDLALGAQPLDAERRIVAGDEQHVEVVRGEPHERLDEAPRPGRAVDLVDVVEHEQELVVAGVLERVGDERRGGLAALLRLDVVPRVDRGGDRRGEVLGERLGEPAERRDDPGGERAEVAVHRVDRVPRRVAGPGDARGEGALPEPGAGDDDRQPAVRAGGEPCLELGAVEGAVGVTRRDELGRPADAHRRGARSGRGRVAPVVGGPLSHGLRMVAAPSRPQRTTFVVTRRGLVSRSGGAAPPADAEQDEVQARRSPLADEVHDRGRVAARRPRRARSPGRRPASWPRVERDAELVAVPIGRHPQVGDGDRQRLEAHGAADGMPERRACRSGRPFPTRRRRARAR